MAALAVTALVGWISGGRRLAPVAVAFCVISLMLLTKVVSWTEIVSRRPAWNMLVWFATLVALADGLNTVGFLKWFAERATSSLSHVPTVILIMAVVALFFGVHYLFASLTAHAAAVLPVFLAALVALKTVPARPATMLMCYSLGLMGILTPYATGPAPIWYASGYIPARDFWRLGFVMGFFYLIALIALGMPWVLAISR